MKKDTHPKSELLNIKCSTCNTKHELLTTSNEVTIDVCSGCHAFYTGDNSIARAAGRVERFNRRVASSNKKV
ncbi:MAG: 50S ribosomal protein L31 [Mycoplasmataceae bacterium]|nr:50S ribosomal protein L31 [Mycoplasmataceae bacterium]